MSTLHVHIDEEDYHEGLIIITIPAGTLSQSFIINITDDDITECNRTFVMIIESASSCRYVIGNSSTTELVVIDDGE